MQWLDVLMQLEPTRALHDYWEHSSPETHVAVVAAGVGGEIAHIDWSAKFSVIALAIMVIGGSLIHLLKQVFFAAIEVRERKRASEDRLAALRRDLKLASAGARQATP